jgi:hypothetical protein
LKFIKENFELVLGLVSSIIIVIIAVYWFENQNVSFAEPVITILEALVSAMVLVVAFNAIRDKYRKQPFSYYFNLYLRDIWKAYGDLLRLQGSRTMDVDLEDGKANHLQIAKDPNRLLADNNDDGEKATYVDFITFPDDLSQKSHIKIHIIYEKFKARADREEAKVEMVSRLIAAQLAYRINENFELFTAEATQFNQHAAIVDVRVNDDLDTEDEAKQLISLINYAIIFNLALD